MKKEPSPSINPNNQLGVIVIVCEIGILKSILLEFILFFKLSI